MARQPTIDDAMEAVARNLRDYGYVDVNATHIAEVYAEYKAGKRFPDLPHGIVGGFAERQFQDNADLLSQLEGVNPDG